MNDYCSWISRHWSIHQSATGYLTLAGVLAAVMLPLLVVAISQKTEDAEGSLEYASTLIFGCFLFCVTSAFFYGVISGDNLCIRANLEDGPASLLLGVGSSMAIVGICWLVKLWAGDSHLLFRIRELSLVGIIFIGTEVIITIEQMVISVNASRETWGSWTENLLIVLPWIIVLFVSSYASYRRFRFSEWIRNSFRVLLPASYFISVIFGTYVTNWTSGHADKRWFWVATAAGISMLFTFTTVSLISLLPNSGFIFGSDVKRFPIN